MSKEHDKQPRVPSFSLAAVATAHKLTEIIDAGGERASLAYGALTRLSVLWAVPMPEAGQCTVIINDMIDIMAKLFPGGEGLPPQEGCPL